MVHTAYDSFQLLPDSQTRIDAVESYGSNLLLACSDGSLRIYGPESSSSDADSSPSADFHSKALKKEPYVLERTINGFSKRPMLAMEVLGSRELLLSLSESISLHRLPNLETTAVITKAKGANVYAWDDRRGLLCFARQRRICIFRHEGGRGFVEVKEFGVPDTVKSMVWCGENVCLGIRREYMVLNATTGTLSEVFSSGRNAPPLVVALSSGELLLGKDNIGVFVDQNGKLLQDDKICWSEAPTSIIIQKPYAIGLLPRHVEIRSLRGPYPLIQTVVLRNVRRLIQCNGAIILALDNSLHGLFPVPLGAQIIQLTASGNFEEALALCRVLPPEDSTLRASKEQSIHLRYAHHLFGNGSYEEAMEHFLESQVDLTYVLALFPYIILPKSLLVAEPVKFVDVGGEVSYISRSSSSVSDDMDSPPTYLLETDENIDVEPSKVGHNTLMALIKYLQKKRNILIEKAAAEGTEEVVSDVVGSNFGALGNGRSKKMNKERGSAPISSVARDTASILDTALLQALILTGQNSAAMKLLKDLNYCDIKICEEFLLKRNQYLSLVELYKCNGMHHEALKLLHQLVEESKSDEPQIELTQKFKAEMIIDYLKPLCATHRELVLEHSMLVLETCPTQTIELYLSGNIPADWVNSFLKQHAPKLQAMYLELILTMNITNTGNLQNEMVQIYFSEVLDWYRDLNSQGQWDEKTFSPTRKKLLSALENISGYTPATLLQLLPTDALYEERAILLGKMNQHELALSIYVHKLHVPELALSYCDRVYESGNHQQAGKAGGKIYLTLLQLYLNPQKSMKTFEKRMNNLMLPQNPGSRKSGAKTMVKMKGRSSRKIASIEGGGDTRVSPSGTDSGRSDVDADDVNEEGASTIMLDLVLDLLSKRWERMHVAQALRMLPKETKLQNLIPVLGPLLRKSSEAYRSCSVIKSLRETENLQVKNDLYDQRKPGLKITGDTMCSLCNKKMGTSAFYFYPIEKTIAHNGCHKQHLKVIGKASLMLHK